MATIAKFIRNLSSALGAMAALAAAAPAALAEQAYDWQLGMQPAASEVRDRIDSLHHELLIIITAITVFVLALLLWVTVRFNAKRNPEPSKISHNTVLEITWTLLPVLILVAIAIPSFKLLYFMDKAEKAEMTLKVTGHQWYWTYEYPDNGNINFDSRIVVDNNNEPAGNPRLLQTDNPVVLPVGTTIRILVSGSDVIHSWFVPAFGVQEYAVIGRVNESWVKIDREGTFYGQCNQICGLNHPFMPIEVHAVSKQEFAAWVEKQKKAAEKTAGPATVAAR
ncbi:MAG TPA: cytochrome c oxidase subunit II [Stellaceae bacterium]|nr:cytochrome c oxidase subunit II [Stellaceae bacterium]